MNKLKRVNLQKIDSLPNKDSATGGIIFMLLFVAGAVTYNGFKMALQNGRLIQTIIYILVWVIMALLLYAVVTYKWFTPRPKATVYGETPIFPGSTTSIDWELGKNSQYVTKIEISLIGFEWAYTTTQIWDGEGTQSDSAAVSTRIFYKEHLATVKDWRVQMQSSLPLTIPETALPSFASDSNAVSWAIQLRYSLRLRLGFKAHYRLPISCPMHTKEQLTVEAKTTRPAVGLPPETTDQLKKLTQTADASPDVFKPMLDAVTKDIASEQVYIAQNVAKPSIRHHWVPIPGKAKIILDAEKVPIYPIGGVITGTVLWKITKRVDAIDLRLLWYTVGKGNRNEKVVQLFTIEQPALQGRTTFQIDVPYWPYSFKGKFVAVEWKVDLQARLSKQPTKQISKRLMDNAASQAAGQIIYISPNKEKVQKLV